MIKLHDNDRPVWVSSNSIIFLAPIDERPDAPIEVVLPYGMRLLVRENVEEIFKMMAEDAAAGIDS